MSLITVEKSLALSSNSHSTQLAESLGLITSERFFNLASFCGGKMFVSKSRNLDSKKTHDWWWISNISHLNSLGYFDACKFGIFTDIRKSERETLKPLKYERTYRTWNFHLSARASFLPLVSSFKRTVQVQKLNCACYPPTKKKKS